jgi:hypothetical protein
VVESQADHQLADNIQHRLITYTPILAIPCSNCIVHLAVSASGVIHYKLSCSFRLIWNYAGNGGSGHDLGGQIYYLAAKVWADQQLYFIYFSGLLIDSNMSFPGQ